MQIFGIIHTIDQYPPVAKHSMESRKSYLFILDHWQEAGEITITQMVSEEYVFAQVEFPDIAAYAEAHCDEGAKEWSTWGSRVN